VHAQCTAHSALTQYTTVLVACPQYDHEGGRGTCSGVSDSSSWFRVAITFPHSGVHPHGRHHHGPHPVHHLAARQQVRVLRPLVDLAHTHAHSKHSQQTEPAAQYSKCLPCEKVQDSTVQLDSARHRKGVLWPLNCRRGRHQFGTRSITTVWCQQHLLCANLSHFCPRDVI